MPHTWEQISLRTSALATHPLSLLAIYSPCLASVVASLVVEFESASSEFKLLLVDPELRRFPAEHVEAGGIRARMLDVGVLHVRHGRRVRDPLQVSRCDRLRRRASAPK